MLKALNENYNVEMNGKVVKTLKRFLCLNDEGIPLSN